MNFTIVGGGSAGWLSALYLNKLFPNDSVSLIESKDIPIIGVGEATTPHIITCLDWLNISYKDVIKNTEGTLKNGINFENWNGDNKKYFHGFSIKNELSAFSTQEYLVSLINNNKSFVDNIYQSQLSYQNKININNQTFALHFDANKFASYLSKIAKQRGVKHIVDNYKYCSTDNNGFINKLHCENVSVKTDFVIDCSGFQKLFIGSFYKETWVDYSQHLPMKKALLFPTNETTEEPYTTAKAMKNGWVFKIPLQHRMGRGYIFDSHYADENEIEKELNDTFKDVKPIRVIKFNAGRYQNAWVKNCIGIGLSTNFVEPLESTSIFMSIAQLDLIKSFKHYIKNYAERKINQYNELVANNNDAILNFIYLHYLTKRNDSLFWKEFQLKNKMPKGLQDTLDDIKCGCLDKFSLPQKTTSSFGLQSYMYIIEGLEITKNLSNTEAHDFYNGYNILKNTVKSYEQNHKDFLQNLST